jgi:hypothetical protein
MGRQRSNPAMFDSKPSSNASGRQGLIAAWEVRLSELAGLQKSTALQGSEELQRKRQA